MDRSGTVVATAAKQDMPVPCLKKDASPELIEAVGRLELQANDCFQLLELLKRPANVAVWACLAGSIRMIEREIAKFGDNSISLDVVLINVGIFATIAIRWTKAHAKAESRLAKRRWTWSIQCESEQALALAYQYWTFEACLPMWHKDRYQVQLVTPATLRFTAPEGGRHRQVSAYQKGFRPSEGIFHRPRPKKEDLSAQTVDLFAALLRRCRRKGETGFACEQPWTLWQAMLPQYKGRASAALRRDGTLSLGEYTLGDFEMFYAALMAVCAVHDYLCFLWQRKHGTYPYDSSVIVHSNAVWVDILSMLSGVPADKCRVMVNELTLGATSWSDLHIHPFVPLDKSWFELAVVPQFPLHSNIDENILRICSTLKPNVFDTATLDKEAGMRDALKTTCPQFRCYGPVKLTNPTPDIDMIVADEVSATIAIIELKWIRKPFGHFERIQRDKDVLKGFSQLSKIRRFLEANPLYLSKYRDLPRRLDGYKHIHYLVVARDHWPWAEPEDGIAIFDFAAFSSAVQRAQNLHGAITELLTYAWLPVEGRDFKVVYESHAANGVVCEAETFYPNGLLSR